MFWIIVSTFILLVLIIVLRPFFSSYGTLMSTEVSEKEILQHRFKELEADLSNRVIDDEQAVLIRQELEKESRRLESGTSGQVDAGTNQQTRNRWAEVLLIVLIFPLSVTGLYQWLGTPAMNTPASGQNMSPSFTDVQNMILQLESYLDEHPEDTRGWVILAHYYMATGREEEAENILETLSQMSESGSQPTEPGDTTEKVITATVSLAPSLANAIEPTDTVFIYAQEIDGPPMPIAAIKHEAKDLPLEVKINDDFSIQPDRKLSAYDYVRLTARISRAGEPTPQSGDFMGSLQRVEVGKKDPVTLEINQEIP